MVVNFSANKSPYIGRSLQTNPHHAMGLGTESGGGVVLTGTDSRSCFGASSGLSYLQMAGTKEGS